MARSTNPLAAPPISGVPGDGGTGHSAAPSPDDYGLRGEERALSWPPGPFGRFGRGGIVQLQTFGLRYGV
jgi:hypothetical protein